jgi:hypothetical protein
MRVLFTSVSAIGHVHPMMPLARVVDVLRALVPGEAMTGRMSG